MTAASHSQAVREMSRSTKFEDVVLASMMVTTLDQYEVMAIAPSASRSWNANESWRSGLIRDMVTSVNQVPDFGPLSDSRKVSPLQLHSWPRRVQNTVLTTGLEGYSPS
jgi:hypothetical protein